MALITPPGHLQAGTYTAKNDRLHIHTIPMTADAANAMAARQGFLSGHVPVVTNPSGMDVTIGAGAALIKNTFTTSGGDYKAVNDGNVTVTLAASSPTLNRYDLVGWQIKDNFYDASGLNTVIPTVVQGANMAGTPVDPAYPASFIPATRAVVNATVTSPTLQSLVGRTVADGGVLPIGSVSERNAITSPWVGLTILRTDRQWEEWYTGSGWHVDGLAVCASVADRDGASGVTTPYTGQLAYTIDTNTNWQRQSGVWVPFYPAGVNCNVRQISAQTIATSGFTALTFTGAGEDFDARLLHDPSTNPSRFTAPVALKLQLTGGIGWASNGTGVRGAMWAKNGTPIDGSQVLFNAITGLATPHPVRTVNVNMAVGDYVELLGFQSSGGNLDTLAAGQAGASVSISTVGN